MAGVYQIRCHKGAQTHAFGALPGPLLFKNRARKAAAQGYKAAKGRGGGEGTKGVNRPCGYALFQLLQLKKTVAHLVRRQLVGQCNYPAGSYGAFSAVKGYAVGIILFKAIHRQLYEKVAHGIFALKGNIGAVGNIGIGKTGAQSKGVFKGIVKAFAYKRRRAGENKPFSAL